MATKTFYDQIPPADGRKYSIQANPDGTSSITDITDYQQQGTPWSAEDANHVYELSEGAMPKTGGVFSDIVRFYGPNYPQLGFMTVTNNSGGLYFAVCGEDRAYKDYIIKSLLSGTKITTSLNGEATQNIPKKAKLISNWKSITESGFYFAAAGSTGNPVSGVAFMGFVFVYEGNNHFGIGRACQGDGSTNHLYFTNGFSTASLKWVQM